MSEPEPLYDHEGNILMCEVCDQEPAVGVASVPSIPVSAAYGRRCLMANAHPYDLLVVNTSLGIPWEALDNPDEVTDVFAGLAGWWQDMVADTLEHLGKTEEQFRLDVIKSIKEMEAEMES